MASELRLPLQVGTSALVGFAHAAAAFVPGVILVTSVGLPVLFAPWDEAWEIYPGLVVPYVFAVSGGVALLAYARKHLRLAMRERPSDVILGPAGIRIEGGPHGGLRAAWADVKRIRFHGRHEKLELVDEEKSKENFWQLELELSDGSSRVLASAEDPIERDSLDTLFESMKASLEKASAGGGGDAGPSRSTTTTALHCANCGAPATPRDEPEVDCAYCKEPVVMPEDVRSRIRAVHVRDESSRASNALVADLVRQPGAGRTSFFVFLAAVPSLCAWPAALVGIMALYALCFLGILNAAALCLAALASIAALFYLVRGQLSDRQALRLITLGFAARAPKTTGGAHHCRRCDAPLVEPEGTIVVRCVHCGAENVLGLDARAEAKAHVSQVESLEDSLAKRRRERTRWRWSAVTALGLLGVAALLVSVSMRPPHELRAVGHATELERITYDPLNEFQAKISPDGQWMLYDLRVPGNDGDESVMLAPSTGAFRGTEMTREKMHGIRPTWTSDGKGFLYVSSTSKRDTLRKVGSMTPYAPATDLYDFAYDIDVPSMSPDGQHVVFAGAESKSKGWAMFAGALDGSPKKPLGAGINPAWSPDGVHIAYSRSVGKYRQIFVATFDGTKLAGGVPITSDSCDHEDPVYARDASYLAYVSNCSAKSRGKKDVWDLYVMKIDGTGNEQLTDGLADVETPAWSGDYVYFSADVAANYDVWRVRLTGPLAGHGQPRAK